MKRTNFGVSKLVNKKLAEAWRTAKGLWMAAITIICPLMLNAQLVASIDLSDQQKDTPAMLQLQHTSQTALAWSPYNNINSKNSDTTSANLIVDKCILSKAGPEQNPSCIKDGDDLICVQRLGPGINPNIASRYVRGTHFSKYAYAVKLEIELCYNETCDNRKSAKRTGGDIQVVVSTTSEGGGAFVFDLNSSKKKLKTVIKNPDEILINNGGVGVSGGIAKGTDKHFDTAYARWQICEVARPMQSSGR